MASTVVAKNPVEFRVFKKNFGFLKDGLKTELNALVPLLYQSDLITQERKDNALGKADMNQRTVDLLNAIECQVKTNPTAFSSFLGVLKSVPALGHLANKLEGDYEHMMKPPLASYSAETPTESSGSQLVAPLEADDETEKTEVCLRDNGAVVTPPPPLTMQPCDGVCVPPHSRQLDTKPSESGVSVFISPTPETSHESKSDIIGTPQALPLAENAPRHSLSVPNGASTQTACVTQPEFRREFRLKLKYLEEFVTTSYSQKEEEVEAQNAELAQISDEVQRQRGELLQVVNQLKEAEQRCEGYEDEICDYEKELKQVESQHRTEKERLENQLLEKTKECKDMALIARQLAKRTDGLEKQNDGLEKRCDELDQLLKNEREEHNQEIQQHKQEIHRLGHEVDSLKLEDVSLCEENTSLCEELKQKEADVRQKETEICSLRKKLESIDSEFFKRRVEIQLKIQQKKTVFQSRLNSAGLLDIEARMKQSVSQLSVFVENEDPVLKQVINDIQQLFNRKIQRSVSLP